LSPEYQPAKGPESKNFYMNMNNALKALRVQGHVAMETQPAASGKNATFWSITAAGRAYLAKLGE
jgi:hypothetical protein